MRVGLVVDEMADAPQLRLPRELAESLARTLGRAQVDPGDHAADPRVRGRVLEHRIGVGVGAGGLHEHRPRHAGPREQRLEVVRLERAPDDGVLGRHPGQGFPLEIPEVLMRVDDHGLAPSGIGGPRRRGAGGRGSAGGRRPVGVARTCSRSPS